MDAKILLVGAGPIGIEMAIALKRCGLSYHHIEAGCLASTIAWYAPGTAFFSSPERLSLAGVPFEVSPHYKATREDYLHYLRSLVKQFELEIETYSRLSAIRKDSAGMFCARVEPSAHGVGGPEESGELTSAGKLSGSSEVVTAKLILAIGDMHLPRLLGIPGEENLFVSHFLRDPHYYTSRKVLIVGGANSAAEAALRLYRVGAKITLVHRGEGLSSERIKPWLLPELRALIREGKVKFLPASNLERVNDKEVLVNTEGKAESIPTDCVLVLTGYRQDPSLFSQLGIHLEGVENAPNFDPTTMETNIPGAYVIGTAVAGSQQRAKHFVETSHIHVNRVLSSLGFSDYPDYSAKLRPVEEREL